MLAPYIPAADLEAAVLHDGQVPRYLLPRFAGITRGCHVYLRPGVYDSGSSVALALLAHELVHVGQYRRGMTWVSYLWSARAGYWDSPYEREARAVQARMLEDLASHGLPPVS